MELAGDMDIQIGAYLFPFQLWLETPSELAPGLAIKLRNQMPRAGDVASFYGNRNANKAILYQLERRLERKFGSKVTITWNESSQQSDEILSFAIEDDGAI